MKATKTPILYVDDEEMNLQLFDMLLNTNFRVYKASSVDSAFQVLEEHDDIEVVFTDWRMPEKDGLAFAKEARKKSDSRQFIMISAFMRNQEIDAALNEGLLASYIPKPFDRQRIISEVNKLTSAN
ncbi:MAG: response regulator [Reichenbachiella sp.]